jgi:hypothetical protein
VAPKLQCLSDNQEIAFSSQNQPESNIGEARIFFILQRQ